MLNSHGSNQQTDARRMILSTQNGGLTIKPVFFNVGEPSNECGFCMSHMLHGAGKYLPTKLIFFGGKC